MTETQMETLAQLAYLDWPSSAKTLGDFVNYYMKEENWPKNKKFSDYKNYLKKAGDDPYLSSLTIVGYQNNNTEGTKSGFVGYAFQDPTSSKDGVVLFRGSENPLEGNINDWLNNLVMETTPSSPQMEDAIKFMKDPDNGAGNLKNIQAVGHSLGGYHAMTQAILDPRVISSRPYNAPGVSDAFFDATEGADKILRNNF